MAETTLMHILEHRLISITTRGNLATEWKSIIASTSLLHGEICNGHNVSISKELTASMIVLIFMGHMEPYDTKQTDIDACQLQLGKL